MRVGVRVHQYTSSMLHAKTLVVDGMALVGTANMDNRSFRLNFELATALFGAGLAELFAGTFWADLQHAVEYRLRTAQADSRMATHKRGHSPAALSAALTAGPARHSSVTQPSDAGRTFWMYLKSGRRAAL